MSGFNIVASNLNAANPALANQQRMDGKPKCCWKCQKDKKTTGGKITMKHGLFKFVCCDCVEAARLRKEQKLCLTPSTQLAQ